MELPEGFRVSLFREIYLSIVICGSYSMHIEIKELSAKENSMWHQIQILNNNWICGLIWFID